MGMAASQGRLLALTARMHDIELRAQNIESQKLSLATQQDAAYQKYCDALDATKIQVGRFDPNANNGITYVDANFNSVCGYHEYNCTQYSMINNLNGKVIVSPEIKDLYETFSGDRYSFAWAAMSEVFGAQFGWDDNVPNLPWNIAYSAQIGYNDQLGFNPHDWAQSVGIDNSAFRNWIYDEGADLYKSDLMPAGQGVDGVTYTAGCGFDLYMTQVEFAVFLNHTDDEELMKAYDALCSASELDSDGRPTESVQTRTELLNEFKDILYSKYGQELLQAMVEIKNGTGDSFELGVYEHPNPDFADVTSWNNVSFQREFNYYTSLWNQITAAGGCEAMPSEYAGGTTGTDWFNNMVSSGMASLYLLDGSDWQVTTIATSVGNNYLQEVNDTEKAKKAEAEYEHELTIINRKDTKFDLQLKKLETEENACKTELDSLKKVRDDNVERTFNLFS